MDTNLTLGMDTNETLPDRYEKGFSWWIRTKLYLFTYLIDAKLLSQVHADRYECHRCEPEPTDTNKTLLHGYEQPSTRELLIDTNALFVSINYLEQMISVSPEIRNVPSPSLDHRSQSIPP